MESSNGIQIFLLILQEHNEYVLDEWMNEPMTSVITLFIIIQVKGGWQMERLVEKNAFLYFLGVLVQLDY